MDNKTLTSILEEVDRGFLVVPDFQRGFKWRVPDVRKLLESLLLDYPIGAALLWRTSNDALASRHVEDVELEDEDDESIEPQSAALESARVEQIEYILDGQQRITSIYKIFPKDLTPSAQELSGKFRGLRFFLDLKQLGLPTTLEQATDFAPYAEPEIVAEAIIEKTHSELRKLYRSNHAQAPQQLGEDEMTDIATSQLWLPITRHLLLNEGIYVRLVTSEAIHRLMQKRPTQASEMDYRKVVERAIFKWQDWFTSTFQKRLISKSLPCLILANERPDGLARIFETINSTGMALSVFDLLVARMGAWGVETQRTNLRSLVQSTVDPELLAKFDDKKSLGGTATQQLPRAFALRADVEPKKGEILRVKKNIFISDAANRVKGLDFALRFLFEDLAIAGEAQLPFKDMVTVLAAVWEPDAESAKRTLRAAMIVASLTEDWDNSTSSKTQTLYRRSRDLVNGKLDHKEREDMCIRFGTSFPAYDSLRDSVRGDIHYRTIMSYVLSRGGRDWEGVQLNARARLEDHHIFPKNWLANNTVSAGEKRWQRLADSVLNRVFVSDTANGSAKAKSPPIYLQQLGAEGRGLLCIPSSFLGPFLTPLTMEQFEELLKARHVLLRDAILKQVAADLGVAAT